MTTAITRKSFGLLWNKTPEAGGVLVGDEVAISIDVDLVQKTWRNIAGRQDCRT